MAVSLTSTLVASDRAEPAQERLERLYGACRDDVYAYVASLLCDRSLAEDVTATAFERAFRRRRLFDARRGSERAWLFAIARNAALDELRRRKRSVPLLGELAEQPPPGGDHSEGSLERAAVQAALAQLSPRERELIALKFHAGLSNPDIARVLGVSETNAGTLLHRTITVVEQVQWISGNHVVSAPKSAASRRSVAMPGVVTSALKEHLTRYAEPGTEGPARSGGSGPCNAPAIRGLRGPAAVAGWSTHLLLLLGRRRFSTRATLPYIRSSKP